MKAIGTITDSNYPGSKKELTVTLDGHGVTIMLDDQVCGILNLSNGQLSCYNINKNGEAEEKLVLSDDRIGRHNRP